MSKELNKLNELEREAKSLPAKDYQSAKVLINKTIALSIVLCGKDNHHIQGFHKVNFQPHGIITCTGNDFVLDAWESGLSEYLSCLNNIKQEIEFAVEFPKPLEYTKQVTIPWLWKNVPAKTLWGAGALIVGLLIASFWFGYEKKKDIEKLANTLTENKVNPPPKEVEKNVPKKQEPIKKP